MQLKFIIAVNMLAPTPPTFAERMQIADMKSNRIWTTMAQILGFTGQPACFECMFVQGKLPKGSLAGSG
ncbi:MAG: hypothetical protein CFE38_00360 [Comamonadaceae bacterium PBBC1]|nr:MAG: hypothetical protein CFE38_00360 [Comamonadaceae bacterium PBBC1]